jgi:tRNA modification GTPase
MYAEDTIAAIATAPGPAGVGIVRLSGPDAAQIGAAIFRRRGDRPAMWESHRFYSGRVLNARGEVLDHGLAVLMQRPRSYTGEDVLELHCHGSAVVLRSVLMAALARGARLAEAGEFTKRAFLNGRLDLAQAEAVIDVVRARTVGGATLAARQLCGQLSDHLGRIRSELVRLKALLEVQIDFSDEEVIVEQRELLAVADRCRDALGRLLATFRHGKIVREGARVAIVGKPNVGKSSLLNALLGEDRAIVTAFPGTTRDTIEETADFDGIPVVLTDTAGLRDERTVDPVERIGMERTSATIDAADLILAVHDVSRPLDAEDRAVAAAARPFPNLVVLNKVDLPAVWRADDGATVTNGGRAVGVSAKHRTGLDALRGAIVGLLDTPISSAGPVLTNERHRDALDKALRGLELARQSICANQAADLVAVDVQDAIDRIGEITGAVTAEDVLDRIFQEFCLGK